MVISLKMKLINKELTETIIGAAYKVHRTLGAGFTEKVYENALVLEIAKQGLMAKQQEPISVYYDGNPVGNYIADVIIENKVICEIKAVDALIRQHEVQLVNYLTATGIDTGLLLNFGSSVTLRRKFKKSNPVNPEKSC